MPKGQFPETLSNCFVIIFPSFACFAGEWVHTAHVPILKVELSQVPHTKAICLGWKFLLSELLKDFGKLSTDKSDLNKLDSHCFH